MNKTVVLARVVLGLIDLRQLPDWALQLLEEGYDSPSLVILAGLPEDEDGWKIDHYFRAALRELGWTLPDQRCAALLVAKAGSDEIFSGKMPVFEGVQSLLDEVINRDFFEEEDKKYVHDGIAFSEAYGLFYSFGELPVSRAWPWQKKIPFNVQVAELEQRLLQSLQRWQVWLDQELKTC